MASGTRRKQARRRTAGAALAELARTVRAHSLRATPGRVAVLRLLRASDRALSHDEVLRRLGREACDRVTVYRCLTQFTRVGLARRVDLGDRTWRFIALDERTPAASTTFDCTACGSVVALDGVTLRGSRVMPRAVRAGQIQIAVRGLCDACA